MSKRKVYLDANEQPINNESPNYNPYPYKQDWKEGPPPRGKDTHGKIYYRLEPLTHDEIKRRGDAAIAGEKNRQESRDAQEREANRRLREPAANGSNASEACDPSVQGGDACLQQTLDSRYKPLGDYVSARVDTPIKGVGGQVGNMDLKVKGQRIGPLIVDPQGNVIAFEKDGILYTKDGRIIGKVKLPGGVSITFGGNWIEGLVQAARGLTQEAKDRLRAQLPDLGKMSDQIANERAAAAAARGTP